MMFKGVSVPAITPFNLEGEVCYDSFRKHLEFLVENKVHGITPCATTGEGCSLTTEERQKLIKITKEVATPRGLPVIAGCGGNNTPAVLTLIEESKALGCDAALVVTPFYNKPTPEGQLAHYRFLADKADFPLILYNVPSRTNINMKPCTIKALLEHPKIVGIKEASGNFGHYLAMTSQIDFSQKALLSGDDDSFAAILALGGAGIISASANVAPRLFVELFEAAEQGSWVKAFNLQKRLYPLTNALFLETNPAPAKCALRLLNQTPSTMRLPLVEVREETEKAIEVALWSVELLS